MDLSGDEVVRPIVIGILRSAPWTHTYLCYQCLLTLAVEQLGPAYQESDVRPALDRIFESPGALVHLQAFRCAKCLYTMPCLGSR
jgi:hypothetical protein